MKTLNGTDLIGLDNLNKMEETVKKHYILGLFVCFLA